MRYNKFGGGSSGGDSFELILATILALILVLGLTQVVRTRISSRDTLANDYSLNLSQDLDTHSAFAEATPTGQTHPSRFDHVLPGLEASLTQAH